MCWSKLSAFHVVGVVALGSWTSNFKLFVYIKIISNTQTWHHIPFEKTLSWNLHDHMYNTWKAAESEFTRIQVEKQHDKDQCPGRFLGITSRCPSVPESNRVHVDIFRFSFIKLGYICSKHSSKIFSNLPAVLMNFNQYFLKLNRFICN